MDSLYYNFNELRLRESDLTNEELAKLAGAEVDSLVGFRKELFRVVSVKPLELLLVKNVGF